MWFAAAQGSTAQRLFFQKCASQTTQHIAQAALLTATQQTAQRAHQLVASAQTARWRLTLWRQLVDDLRQHLRQAARDFVLLQPRLLGDIAQHVVAKNLTDLIGRNRHILAIAYPRLQNIAQVSLAKHAGQTTQAAFLAVVRQHFDDDRSQGDQQRGVKAAFLLLLIATHIAQGAADE